jgi:hypothetical protein
MDLGAQNLRVSDAITWFANPKFRASFVFAICKRGRTSQTSKPERIALKMCKPYQTTGKNVFSLRPEVLFHKLINTCVGNLIVQKYFPTNSA